MAFDKILLIVLDGWGIAQPSPYNAISQSKTPFIDSLFTYFSPLTLQASGIGVGLLYQEVGNSEVGHMNIGAGRIVRQFLSRIVADLRDNSFYKNESLLKAVEHAKKNNSRIHIVGLLSSGSVHAYSECINGVIETMKQNEIQEIIVHIFTDGKDAPSNESIDIITRKLNPRLKNTKYKTPGTLIGRMYAMDRNQNWPLTQKAYDALCGISKTVAQDPIKYLEECHKNKETDYAIEPCIIQQDETNIPRIQDNDAIIFTNFREDSMRQITESFITPSGKFKKFKRNNLKNLCVVTMTDYNPDFKTLVVYPPPQINQPLASVISSVKKRQLHIAETEKYAHVTYFFNGEKEKPFPGEDRVLIRSVGGPYYENHPKMQTEKIVQEAINRMKYYSFVLLNIANADILGHTGNYNSALEGIEEIDTQLSKLIKKASSIGFTTIITADHGNAESMIDINTGDVITSHTNNPVPFLIVNEKFHKKNISELYTISPKGVLGDVAPTILELMNIEKPPEMNGNSLLPNIQ